MLFTKFDIPGTERAVFFDNDTIVSLSDGTIEQMSHRDYAGLRTSYEYEIVEFADLSEDQQVDYLQYRVESGTATQEEKALYDAL